MANEFDYFKCPMCIIVTKDENLDKIPEILIADWPKHVEEAHGEILAQAEEDQEYGDLILMGEEEDLAE